MSEVAVPDPAVPPPGPAGRAGPPAVGRAAVPPPRQPGTVHQPGTVYRAAPDREPVVDPPSDGSGSLTGFILSRGRVDASVPKWRLAVIAVVILLMIALLAVIGLVAVGSLFDRLLGD